MYSDSQFYGTVHVISWTVVLILSSRKIKWKRRKISAHVFVSFQDFVGKNKELFCLKPGQIQQRRGIILNTGNLDLWSEFDIGNLFIGELFITGERTFQTVKLSWKGGKGTVKQANSRLTELRAGQWYICLTELKEVNFGGFAKSVIVVGKLFNSFDELLSSLEITLNLFISAMSSGFGSIFVILDHFRIL